ncbi:type II toxin-antitoxin system VapC family toxin [Sulfurovum sp. bin170]|uniref:type II toxin-antitoxin system VapC family toxin n=1 Tax=Sulfurovum sp. bin170 TaxID=2695268 RepID=UPI0013DF6394|nr:type II toxin-antitoxin system VapC family toxin [Sulfurovum sp. bin170]NEW59666.1 type II toxin-antitoxin system VapC family toxin [Sulfurovum sp. bin170]
MNKYILDTDIVSYLWDKKSAHHHKVVEHLNYLNDDDIVGISVISIYELTYGMDSFKNEELKAIFKNALEFLQNDQDTNIFSLDANGATFFSQLKLQYKKATGITAKDAKKNDLDLVIASISMGQEAILISNDGIFKRLAELEPKFKYENWLN